MAKGQTYRWNGVDKVMVPLAVATVLLWALVKFI